jgi:hypothetical protein
VVPKPLKPSRSTTPVRIPASIILRDAISALSLANLVFLRLWAALIAPYGDGGYTIRREIRPVNFAALTLDLFALAILLFLVFQGIRRQQGQPPERRSKLFTYTAAALFGVCALAILNSADLMFSPAQTSPWLHVARRVVVGAGALMGAVCIVAFITSRKGLVRFGLDGLAIVSPLLPIILIRALLIVSHFNGAALAQSPGQPRLRPVNTGPHVLWVIFDEWDERLSFPDRRPGWNFPEMDRIRREALYSDAVIGAAHDTDWAMPGLTIGTHVQRRIPNGPNDLLMWLDGAKDPLHWNKCPNVFSDARKAGFDTGVVAWALPYCRVLDRSLTGCWWQNAELHDDAVNAPLPGIMAHQARAIVERRYLSPFGQSLEAEHHAWLYQEMLKKATEVATTRPYNLTLLHFCVPHAPYFYNAKTGRDDLLFTRGQSGYADALALVDKTIGELRRSMEAVGVWDSTTLLISADHGLRDRLDFDGKPFSRTVPFILKLAGQHDSREYNEKFAALLSRRMLLSILQGEIATTNDMAQWLDRNRSTISTEYHQIGGTGRDF